MAVGERLRVAVLMGGTSAEHEVSICSGLNVLDALDRRRFEAVPVTIDRDGGWSFGVLPTAPSLATTPGAERPTVTTLPSAGQAAACDGAYERLRSGDLDVVFVALHGPGGEDGQVQGMLSLAGIPFTGSGVLASALAMDKRLAKRLVAAAGARVALDLVLSASGVEDARQGGGSLSGVTERVGLPCVVKPVAGGSSFGIRVVNHEAELGEALELALAEDSRVLVERFVTGTEVTCGVLGGGVDPLQALPLTEIVPVEDTFFDFHAKYTSGACEEITPARVDPVVSDEVQRLAVLAHSTLGCEGFSRSDFIIGAEGPVYLETNTVPGLTAGSLFPQGAAAAGIGFAQLLERLIDSALLRAGAGR